MTRRIAALAVLGVLSLSGCMRAPGIMPDPDGHTRAVWGDRGIRTAGVQMAYPRWLIAKPEDAAFSGIYSNHDPVNDHPAQWAGQGWDATTWGRAWTAEVAVRRLFEADIFRRQYRERGTAVIELGPKFYRISDLDRRRALDLFVESAGLLRKGNGMVALRDWRTGAVVGSYVRGGVYMH